MKGRIAALAVGLAVDCDRPQIEVEKVLNANLPGASTLPFVAFVGHDFRWAAGFSGFRDTGKFLEVLGEAERSPILAASDAVRKKLAALGERAGKAADRGEWKAVLAAERESAESWGRCPEKESIAALGKRAREWAAAQLDAAVRIARERPDLTEARRVLNEVKKHFGSDPEGAEADAGLKAVQRLSNIVAAETGGIAPAGIREKAAKEYAGTRWAPIFEKAPPADAPPAEGDAPKDGGK